MAKPESKIQSELIAHFEAQDYMVIKLMATNRNGIPDLLLLKDGKAEFVEVKRPGKQPTDLQLKRMEELEKYGCRCRVLTDGGQEIERKPLAIRSDLGF